MAAANGRLRWLGEGGVCRGLVSPGLRCGRLKTAGGDCAGCPGASPPQPAILVAEVAGAFSRASRSVLWRSLSVAGGS